MVVGAGCLHMIPLLLPFFIRISFLFLLVLDIYIYILSGVGLFVYLFIYYVLYLLVCRYGVQIGCFYANPG